MKSQCFMPLRNIFFLIFISISINAFALKATQVDVKENSFTTNITADADTNLQDILEQVDAFTISTFSNDSNFITDSDIPNNSTVLLNTASRHSHSNKTFLDALATTDNLPEGITNTYNPFGSLIDESELNISNSPTLDYFIKWNGTGMSWSFVEAGGTWGSITGTLSNQTDLQSALNLKANTADLNIINWDTAYGWGNHADVGYLTSIDQDLHNYSWTNVTDTDIPDSITIDAGGSVSEGALPSSVLLDTEVTSKSDLDTLISETLVGATTNFGGDVSGTYDNLEVTGITGREIDDSALANGTIMQYNSATGRFEFIDPADLNLGLYASTFTDSELVGGVLTIAHAFNLDANYKIKCTIYDNNNEEFEADVVTIVDENNITVDLSSMSPITDTWSFVVMGDGGQAVPRSVIVRTSDGDTIATNITTIKFDQDTGFIVTDEGGGVVEVSLGSHWKDLVITGQDTLTPTGEESLQFVAGTGILLSTNSSSDPKTITITNTGGGEGGGGVATSGVQATRISNQLVSSASEATILFDSENWDIGGEFSTVTGRFTPSEAGYYYVSATALWNSVNASKTMAIYIRTNNGLVRQEGRIFYPAGSQNISVNAVAYADGVDDYIYIVVYNGDSSSRNISNCYVDIMKVG